MALTRLNEFNTGTTLTEAALEGELDNIYNNALTLISPLTANLAAGGFIITGLGLGTAASPTLQLTGDTNTGIYSSGADALDLVGGGLRLATLTSTPSAGIVSIDPGAISATASTNVGRLFVGGTSALTVPAGTTAIVAGLWVAEPNLTATGTITSATSVYIAGAPTEGGSNSSLWVDAGNVRFDASIGMGVYSAGTAGSIQWNATADTGPSILGTAATLRFKGGTTDTEWYNQANATELMRLTNGGVLALGTTVVTGAAAGEFVLKNDSFAVRSVNAAGTNTFGLIAGDASDRVYLLPNGTGDIRWGKALVALGGGSAATLGTAGGSGPVTATQNTWMQVVDSAGATFWLPAWK